MSDSLFHEDIEHKFQPLAARMRPQNLAQYIGQEHLLGKDKPLRKAIETGQIHSMLLWGPPGTGKTSLAKLLTSHIDGHFQDISAVLSGVKDIRQAVDDAKHRMQFSGKKTVLFVDEVHRFNKAQQDAFLPFVEDGTLIFVGATTENPSFEVNNALLSRCRVYVLKALSEENITQLLQMGLEDEERGLGSRKLQLESDAAEYISRIADGDARRALTLLELAADLVDDGAALSKEIAQQVATSDLRRFDKGGEHFYDQISALHKSVRGSAPDAALYWFARMLDGGCDPLYIARRVVRMATEDIGNADPRGLELALNAWTVQERLGSPEGELAISQAILFLAAAPKSNAVYNAHKLAMADVAANPSYDVPLRLRNAPTKLMKSLDYGAGYRYAHDEPDAFAAGERYFPDEMEEQKYYQPVERGLEIKIAEKLRTLEEKNAAARGSEEPKKP